MSKICPFMSGAETTRWGHSVHEYPRGIHYQDCLEDRCMMWIDESCAFPKPVITGGVDWASGPDKTVTTVVKPKDEEGNLTTGFARAGEGIINAVMEDVKNAETQATMRNKAVLMHDKTKRKMYAAYDKIREKLRESDKFLVRGCICFQNAHEYWEDAVRCETDLIRMKYADGSMGTYHAHMHYVRRYEERTKEYEKMLEENLEEREK